MKHTKRLALMLVMLLVVSMLAAPIAQAASYTVVSGDVLWKIAQKHGTTYQELAEVNGIKNPHLIFPGQVINIPEKGEPAPTPPAPPEPAPEPTPEPEPEVPVDDGTVTVTLLHTNDTHARMMQEKNTDGAITIMGFAAIKNIFDAKKAENPNTLLVDAGDTLHGKNFVNLNKGSAAIEVLNLVGYTAMAPGNHDFNYGTDRLLELAKAAKFPVLACNVIKKADSTYPFAKYTIVELSGVKVAFIGVATPETLVKTHPDNVKDYDFLNPVEAVKAVLPELAGKADVLVALAHLGEIDEFSSEKLANAVPELAVIIDGHTHSVFENKFVNGVLMAQTGEYDNRIGVVTLKVKDGKVIAKTASFITAAESETYGQNAEVLAKLDELQKANDLITGEVVAKIDIVLNGERADVRTKETNLGNLVAESLLAAAPGADVAIINGGNLRKSLQPGDMKLGDVLEVLPFDNYQMVKKLTGAQLLAVLEHGLASLPNQFGGFPHVAGMTVKYDSSKEVGKRVLEVKVAGQPLDLAKEYKLVINNFLAAGGDGYEMLKDAETVLELGTDTEIFIAFLKAGGIEKAVVDGRMTDTAPAVPVQQPAA